LLLEEEDDNHYLTLSSVSGAETVLTSVDGLFEEERTILDFRIKSDTASTAGNADLLLTEQGVDSTSDAHNIVLLRFHYNGLFLMGNSQYKLTFEPEKWYDVKITVDRRHNQITVSSEGLTATTELSNRLVTSDTLIRLKSAQDNCVSLDNMVVSDAFYHEIPSYQLKEDFDYMPLGYMSGYGVTDGLGTTVPNQVSVIRDGSSPNRLLQLQCSAESPSTLLHTATIDAEKTVLEFDLRLSPETYKFDVYVRISSSESIPLLSYYSSVLYVMDQAISVSVINGKPANFRFVLTSEESCAVFVNGKLIDTFALNRSIIGADIRFHCNRIYSLPEDPSVTTVYLDDMFLYTPVVPQMRVVSLENGTEEAQTAKAIVLKSNQAIDMSTLQKEHFLLNGSADNIKSVSGDSVTNECFVYLNEALDAETEYTIEIKPNTIKDCFGQYFDFQTSFDTGVRETKAVFKKDGVEISKIEPGKITAEIKFASGDLPQDGVVFMAHYQNNTLMECYVFSGEEGKYSQTFDTNATSKLCIMAWDDLDTLMPCINEITFDQTGKHQ